jgi:hypothetical protein
MFSESKGADRMNDRVAEFYGTVMACPTVCCSTIRDLMNHVPRGFVTAASPGDDVLLCITPAPPHPTEPVGYYWQGEPAEKQQDTLTT